MVIQNIPSKLRFSNINILEAMEHLVENYVICFKSDFYDHDVHTIQDVLGKTKITDRRFLWLRRRYGTYLFTEIDVITRIPERRAFEYFYEFCDDTLLFAIEAHCRNKDIDAILGDLFLLDYGEEYFKMKEIIFTSDGKDADKSLYEAMQWNRHLEHLAYPDTEFTDLLQMLETQTETDFCHALMHRSYSSGITRNAS